MRRAVVAAFVVVLSVPLVLLAFRFTTIDVPGADAANGGTAAEGINAQGDVVGLYSDSQGVQHAFLRKRTIFNTTFTTIDPPGSEGTAARGINALGDIAGDYSDDVGSHGFLLSNGRFTTVDVPGGTDTLNVVINDFKEIAGTYFDTDGNPHGFVSYAYSPLSILHGKKFTTIDFPGSLFTLVTGISNSGDVVGYYRTDTLHGFLLSNGKFSTIEPTGATGSMARGINTRGDIVGTYADATGAGHAFLFRKGILFGKGTFTDIDLPGARARAINDLGNIVGFYIDNSGNTHGFEATQF